MKILAHATYVGTTGYNSHCQKFFRKLSQYHDLKIRNFTIGKNWQGYDKINENPHGNDVSELDKKLIGLQSLWNPLNQLEDHEVYGFKKDDFNLLEFLKLFFYSNNRILNNISTLNV